MESLNKQEIGFLKEQITDLKNQVADVKREMSTQFTNLNAKLEILIEGYVKKEELEKYVTLDAFRPTRAIAYTIILTIGLAVLGAIIKLVIIPNA